MINFLFHPFFKSFITLKKLSSISRSLTAKFSIINTKTSLHLTSSGGCEKKTFYFIAVFSLSPPQSCDLCFIYGDFINSFISTLSPLFSLSLSLFSIVTQETFIFIFMALLQHFRQPHCIVLLNFSSLDFLNLC